MEANSGPVTGVVLGAGSSTRLGRPKQLLPFGGTTLLDSVIRGVVASSLDRVVVVLGGAGEDVARSLSPSRAVVVHNDSFGSGCASSLLAGLDAAGDDGAAIMLLLGDMPGVDSGLIDSVLGQWRDAPSWAAVTGYQDRLGHPMIFRDDSFSTLRSLHGDKAVWKLVDQEPPERMRRIDVDRRCPLDVDTWADYEAVLRLSSRS